MNFLKKNHVRYSKNRDADREFAELLHQAFPEQTPLIPNNDTSTEEGMAWRRHVLQGKARERIITALQTKYQETHDKSVGYRLAQLTGEDFHYDPYWDERG